MNMSELHSLQPTSICAYIIHLQVSVSLLFHLPQYDHSFRVSLVDCKLKKVIILNGD